MAFVTTETNVININGGPVPLLLITGTYTNSGGGTGGIVAAGYTNASGALTAISGAASIGGRLIVADWYRPTTNDATAPGAAVSQNNTIHAQVATLVTDANSTGNYYLLCLNEGA